MQRRGPRLGHTGHQEIVRRFYQEIKAVGALEHPNIVSVFDVGAEGLIYELVSAYIPGPTLAQWLQQQTEPVPVRAPDLPVARVRWAPSFPGRPVRRPGPGNGADRWADS